MDGRDLLKEVCPNWTSNTKLVDIANELPKFLSNVINAPGYKFYGKFQLGAIYDLTNFDNMLVSKIYLLTSLLRQI